MKQILVIIIRYNSVIIEYNNCFENKNHFNRNFEVVREIGFVGFGKVFEIKSLLDSHKYAVKKTITKGKKTTFVKII